MCVVTTTSTSTMAPSPVATFTACLQDLQQLTRGGISAKTEAELASKITLQMHSMRKVGSFPHATWKKLIVEVKVGELHHGWLTQRLRFGCTHISVFELLSAGGERAALC